MNVAFRLDKDILYIALEGRIDATNASEAEEKIFSIKNANPGKHTVIDADKLEYVSSAGLRVILRVRKEEPKLAIINVSPDVYEVFDMTGFTDMLTVEKAYPKMSVEGCEFIAQGANGAVYRYNEETILKTYFNKDALPEIKQERENARKAFVLGVPTAIPYGIVRVGDGYGTVTELLNAVSVTKLIRDNPEDFSKAADYYIGMLKTIHAIEVEDGEVPDMKEIVLGWVEYISPHLSEELKNRLLKLIGAIPKCNTLLHGDYHMNNIMVQNGEPLLVDMDTLCMGHPVFELAFMFNALIGYSENDPLQTRKFFGFEKETARKFWATVLKMFVGSSDEEVCRSIAEKAMTIGYIRMLRRSMRHPEEAESSARIERCKEMLETLSNKLDSLVF